MLSNRETLDLFSELNNILGNKTYRSLLRDDSKVEGGHWAPAVDIKEESNQFILYVDIPGVEPKDIDISMENNILTVKGKRQELSKEDRTHYHRIERINDIFYRQFTLPNSADAEQISAKINQGVLEIIIGKKKLAQSRKIEVQTEG